MMGMKGRPYVRLGYTEALSHTTVTTRTANRQWRWQWWVMTKLTVTANVCVSVNLYGISQYAFPRTSIWQLSRTLDGRISVLLSGWPHTASMADLDIITGSCTLEIFWECAIQTDTLLLLICGRDGFNLNSWVEREPHNPGIRHPQWEKHSRTMLLLQMPSCYSSPGKSVGNFDCDAVKVY